VIEFKEQRHFSTITRQLASILNTVGWYQTLAALSKVFFTTTGSLRPSLLQVLSGLLSALTIAEKSWDIIKSAKVSRKLPGTLLRTVTARTQRSHLATP
jgi:hypothetical protein